MEESLIEEREYDLAEAIKNARENFLKERTKLEMYIEEKANELRKCDASIFEGIEIPSPFTLKTLIPEMYEEVPDKELYEAQCNAVDVLFEKINEVVMRLNDKAKELIKEYEFTVVNNNGFK